MKNTTHDDIFKGLANYEEPEIYEMVETESLRLQLIDELVSQKKYMETTICIIDSTIQIVSNINKDEFYFDEFTTTKNVEIIKQGVHYIKECLDGLVCLHPQLFKGLKYDKDIELNSAANDGE